MPEPTDDPSTPVQGWDSLTTEVDGRWIDRRPRRPAVARRLRNETRVMPWLADRLSVRAPRPYVINDEPLVVRHERVPGEPIVQLDHAAGRALAVFLRSLHSAAIAEATDRGLPTAEASLADRTATLKRFCETVVPLLPAEVRSRATALLEILTDAPADTVIHGDLGPEHILCTGNTLTGVIDFTDAHVGDAALDLSWALHDTPPEFAAAVADGYGASATLRHRALSWHQLAPWHEVAHGQDQNLPQHVHAGLEGVLRRLQ